MGYSRPSLRDSGVEKELMGRAYHRPSWSPLAARVRTSHVEHQTHDQTINQSCSGCGLIAGTVSTRRSKVAGKRFTLAVRANEEAIARRLATGREDLDHERTSGWNRCLDRYVDDRLRLVWHCDAGAGQ